MSFYLHSMIWAVAMVLVALASLLGLIGERAGDIMLMAALGGWAATAPRAGRGTCRIGSLRS